MPQTTVNFPNGESAMFTAQTEQSFATFFQSLIAQILGYAVVDANGNPQPQGSPCWYNVRVGWQQEGQPAQKITEDICFLTATTDPHPFTLFNDEVYYPNDYKSLLLKKAYTQVWKLHICCYGPSAFQRAAFIVECLSLDWVNTIVKASNIYFATEWNRPVYAPELKDGRWWQRADTELRFNELVTLTTIVPSAASVAITLLPSPADKPNQAETFTVEL